MQANNKSEARENEGERRQRGREGEWHSRGPKGPLAAGVVLKAAVLDEHIGVPGGASDDVQDLRGKRTAHNNQQMNKRKRRMRKRGRKEGEEERKKIKEKKRGRRGGE